jgi:hypothetical protein
VLQFPLPANPPSMGFFAPLSLNPWRPAPALDQLLIIKRNHAMIALSLEFCSCVVGLGLGSLRKSIVSNIMVCSPVARVVLPSVCLQPARSWRLQNFVLLAVCVGGSLTCPCVG